MAKVGRVSDFELIFREITKERAYQDKLYGPDVDDEYNDLNDWSTYIARYATHWWPGGFPPYENNVLKNFRKSMIKTAALAVAAIEWTDRELQRRNA